MRQKNPSSSDPARYDFLHSLKTAALPAASVAAYLFFLSTVPSLMNLTAERNPDFCFSSGGYGNSAYPVLIGFGALTAFLFFRFLLSVRQTNVGFSLGLSRTRLFMNRCAAAGIAFLLAVTVPLALTLLVNIGFYGVKPYIIKVFLLFAVSAAALIFIGFSVFLLAMLFTGTNYAAAGIAAVLLLVPSLFQWYVPFCFQGFLRGYGYEYNQYIGDIDPKSSAFNPLTLLYDPSEQSYGENIWDNYSGAPWFTASTGGPRYSLEALDFSLSRYLPYILWLIASLLLLGVSWTLFTRRKAENNGRKNMRVVPVLITTFIVLLVFCANFALYHYNYSTYSALSVGGKMAVWEYILMPPAVVLLLCLWVFTRKREAFIKSLRFTPLVLLLAVTPVVCYYGGFGYASRIPDGNEVTVIQVEGFLGHADLEFNVNDDTLSGFKSDKDKALILSLHETLIGSDKGTNKKEITITYTLNNGKTMSRYYPVCSDESLRALEKLFDSDAAETYLHNRFGDKTTWLDKYEEDFFDWTIVDPAHPNDISWISGKKTVVTVTYPNRPPVSGQLKSKDFEKLLSCLAADFVNINADGYFAFEPQSAVKLTFTTPESYGYLDGSKTFLIRPSMTKTLACLEELKTADALK